MPNDSRKRSRPKAGIQPIHVHELLSGAGMTGFLSVLQPRVAAPHLRQLTESAESGSEEPPAADAGAEAGAAPEFDLPDWISARAAHWSGLMSRQENALAETVELADRIQRRAAAIVNKLSWCARLWQELDRGRGEDMRRVKTAAATPIHRKPADSSWDAWVSSEPVNREGPVSVADAADQRPAAPSKKEITEALAAAKPASRPAPTQEEIARLAYLYWQQRGCPPDSATEDWLRAEAELRK